MLSLPIPIQVDFFHCFTFNGIIVLFEGRVVNRLDNLVIDIGKTSTLLSMLQF